MRFSFPATERLKSKKQIEHLFEFGQTAAQFPIKAWFLPAPGASCTKVAFAVPKRSFKKAVDRNRIKRQLREAYRLQKADWDKNGTEFVMLLLYMDKQPPEHQRLHKAVAGLLKKLSHENFK